MSNRTTRIMLPTDLPPSWRSLAETFREHAAEPLALAYERCAEQLDQGPHGGLAS